MYKSSRDVIIRAEAWADAVRFYESVFGFEIAARSAEIVGFETGALRLYVEKSPDMARYWSSWWQTCQPQGRAYWRRGAL